MNKLHDQIKHLNAFYDRNDAVVTIGMEISQLGKNVVKLARADPYFDVTKLPQAVALPMSLRLPPDNGACSHGDPKRFFEYKWFRLWLSKALRQYKTRLLVKEDYRASDQTFADGVCQPKLTITTQFQLLFDVSAGTSILQSIPIIFPVSGLNIDASPDYTHFIQIIFSLRPYGRYDQFGVTPLDEPTKQRIEACSALQITTNPPASAR